MEDQRTVKSRMQITVDLHNGNGPYTTSCLAIDWVPVLKKWEEENPPFTSAADVAEFIERTFVEIVEIGNQQEEN